MSIAEDLTGSTLAETKAAAPTHSRAAVWMALLAVYVCWGSTYLAIRFAIETLPPFVMAGTRFIIAGAFMYAWAVIRGVPRASAAHWRNGGIVGLFLLLGGNGLVVWSEQLVPSGIVALVVGLSPFWMVLLSWWWEKTGRPQPVTILGVIVGFIGLAVLVVPDMLSTKSGAAMVHPLGALAVIGATLSWAIGSIYSRKVDLPSSPILTTAIEMLCGGTAMLVFGLLVGEGGRIDPGNFSMKSLLAFGYLVVFGSIIGFSSYVYLLTATTPAKASTYAFVNPVVAVILGWALAGEVISGRVVISGALIVGAVILISLAREKQKRA